MKRNSFIPCVLLSLALVASGGPAAAQVETDKDTQKREADHRAIDQLTRDLIDAFDQRDVLAIVARWTDNGEFSHNNDEPVRGRADIQKGYEEFFNTLQGNPKLEIESDALHFPSANMAVKDTTLRLKNDDGEVVASGRQHTVLVREGGQWKVAIVHEQDRDVGLDANLKELDWLIGTWRAVTKDREVTITYEWNKNRAFICGTFTVKEGSTVVDSGTEMIGKDNAKGVIRSWLFQSDGGFGTGTWKRDGKTWRIDVNGVTSEGCQLTGTVVYAHVDHDTFTWQAVNLALSGEPIDNTPPIKVAKRPTPAK